MRVSWSNNDFCEFGLKSYVRKSIGLKKFADEGKPKQPTGEVVAIIKRAWRNYCGVIEAPQPGSSSSSQVKALVLLNSVDINQKLL